MIRITADATGLVLEYTPDRTDSGWVARSIDEHGSVTIGRVFEFETRDLLVTEDDPVVGRSTYGFRLATRDGDYHRIPARVLGTARDVMIANSGIRLERKHFVAEQGVSIFHRINEIVGPMRTIVIGGDEADSIPIEEFERLIRRFPSGTELRKYSLARVAGIITEYIEGEKDFRAAYEAYLNKRVSPGVTRMPAIDTLLLSEIEKYEFIRDTITSWLSSADNRSERDWQQMILQFILLIFPKYVAVLQNVTIKDHYSRPGAATSRFIDIALVDANGNLDIIEIKRPMQGSLLSTGRYRDNFVPTKELSGTIMQAEKYLFHLSKWGVAGETAITSAHAAQLPPDLQVRITNPRAILILGRDKLDDGKEALTPAQSFDLELIKRKYANMMDIITYDDLLRRLERMIASLRRRVTGGAA